MELYITRISIQPFVSPAKPDMVQLCYCYLIIIIQQTHSNQHITPESLENSVHNLFRINCSSANRNLNSFRIKRLQIRHITLKESKEKTQTRAIGQFAFNTNVRERKVIRIAQLQIQYSKNIQNIRSTFVCIENHKFRLFDRKSVLYLVINYSVSCSQPYIYSYRHIEKEKKEENSDATC